MPSENQTVEEDETMQNTNITKNPKTEISRIISEETLIDFIASFNVMGLVIGTPATS